MNHEKIGKLLCELIEELGLGKSAQQLEEIKEAKEPKAEAKEAEAKPTHKKKSKAKSAPAEAPASEEAAAPDNPVSIEDVKGFLKDYQDKLDGSPVENKKAMVAFFREKTGLDSLKDITPEKVVEVLAALKA